MRSALATVALALALAACAVARYEPLVVTPAAGLPADAFARCVEVLRGRYGRVVVADAAAFRLQTDWVPGPDAELAQQLRASVFREGEGLGVVVEARYLRLGWFDRLPEWSAPRPDPALERDLAAALTAGIGG